MASEPETPGERIRWLRKQRGLSVSQVAIRTGQSESGVRAHENGQNGIRADVAEVYATLLKGAPEWILYGTGGWPDDEEEPPRLNFLRAWREFRKMSEAELANLAGSTEATVKQLELSNRPLSAKLLRQFAPALRTTEGLLGEVNPNELTPEVVELWIDIPEESRPAALAMLRGLARR